MTPHSSALNPSPNPGPAGAEADPKPPGRERLVWLDFYRGLAVLIMIETHVVNTFLDHAFANATWRVNLNYFNGLIAPGFLFIAGFAHGSGARRKSAVRSRTTPRLLRLATIAAIGLAMQIPWRELRAAQWSEAWLLFTRMNILPCLAAAIAVLVLLDRFVAERARWVAGALLVVTVLAAPFTQEWTHGSVLLRGIFTHTTGSLFPVLPWAAFAFAGYIASAHPPEWRRFLPASAVLVGVVFALGRVNLGPTSVAFFCERLAWELAFVPLCGFLASLCAPRALLFAGRESLFMYVAHLALISALESVAVPRVGPAATLLLYAAVLAATFAVVRFWRAFSV